MSDSQQNQSSPYRSLALFLIALIALASVTPPALLAEPLRIAYTSIAMVYGPLWLTKEAGIFKKHNIEPELLYIGGGPPSLQALIAGDVAISFTAAGAVVAANLSGSDVVLLGTTIDSLPFELYTVPSIKEPERLRGTKMGVSRIGATTDFIARYLLKRWGLQPDKDVAIFQAGAGPQVYAALKAGSVQSGILSAGPETIRAQTDGFFRLADVATSGLAYPFGPFATRQTFAQSNPQLVARFMRAYVEGIYRFKTDKAAALATIEKYTKTQTSLATEKIYEVYANRYVKRIPEVTRDGIQTILSEIASSRPLPNGVAPDRFVESRFMREISDSGYADSLYRKR